MRSEKKISPALERALGEIGEKELTLNDLPVARDAGDWGTINRSAKLQLLELVALKTCREDQQQRSSSSSHPLELRMPHKGLIAGAAARIHKILPQKSWRA